MPRAIVLFSSAFRPLELRGASLGRNEVGILALYVVATPIGNMEDITLRALKTLKEVQAIIAEDTRTYRKLAARHAIPAKPVYSLYKGNESARVEQILPRLADGLEAALVTESGTPAVSDPGALLIRRCLESGVRVVPLPGPSSLAAAISIAGIFSGPVTFLGFLSKKKPGKELLETMASGSSVVFFEHAGRLPATLKMIADQMPGARVVVAREMTKRHEEIWNGTASCAADEFGKKSVKGEVVVIAEPVGDAGNGDDVDCTTQIRETLAKLRDQGVSVSVAVRQIGRLPGVARREIYRQALEIYSVARDGI